MIEPVRTVTATRYVTPLREGGSLPAIIEADDLGTYVLKFRGAGQGAKVLVTELIVGELGRVLGLPVPEIVLVDLDPVLGRSEPDAEIQALIYASAGLNLALDYLPGSYAYDPILTPPPDAALASAIVWFDSLVTNVDRTAKNTNMLIWHRNVWLIDHGAALYWQHAPAKAMARAQSSFPAIRSHVLLPFATQIDEADKRLTPMFIPPVVQQIVELVPEDWLDDRNNFATVEEQRGAYSEWLLKRLEEPHAWVEEAIRAQTSLV